MELCLNIFEVIFGLKVNMVKSCMVGIHVENGLLVEMADIMGCTIRRWSPKYLIMPLDGSPKSVSFWDSVVEKVSKVCWKRSYIPLGGKNYPD